MLPIFFNVQYINSTIHTYRLSIYYNHKEKPGWLKNLEKFRVDATLYCFQVQKLKETILGLSFELQTSNIFWRY
jgi:hypothetical protein